MARFRDSMLAGWPGLTALIWLAAIIDSPIHRIWRLGWLAGWARLGWAVWLAISWIFIDFRRFHKISWISGVRGSQPVAACANGMMPLKKALLDSSWLLYH